MPHLPRMFYTGKLNNLRVGLLLTFVVLFMFSYVLFASHGLLRLPTSGGRGKSCDRHGKGKDENSDIYNSNHWGRWEHAVVPIACNGTANRSELMAMEPPNYLPNYKNPCWWERIDRPIPELYSDNRFSNYSYALLKMFDQLKRAWSHEKPAPKYRLRCLPYFLLAGQPKCGSTDIYKRLIAHPDIAAPPIKEPHWWGKNRYGWCLNFTATIPFPDYVDLFDKAAISINNIVESNREDEDYHPAITGDASVSTLWSNDDWWKNPENCGLTEPRFTNAHHVHRLLPGTKIIVILRDPVDRLYSDFLYFQHRDKAQDLFHDAAQRAIEATEDCVLQSGIRACLYNYTVSSKSRARLRIGLYHEYLQEWLSVFPRDQLLVLRLEDYASNPLTAIRRVNKFLGLRSLSQEEADTMLEKPVFNRRRASDKKLGKMLPKTRVLLNAFYAPYNARLARLLGDDRFLWNDGQS